MNKKIISILLSICLSVSMFSGVGASEIYQSDFIIDGIDDSFVSENIDDVIEEEELESDEYAEDVLIDEEITYEDDLIIEEDLIVEEELPDSEKEISDENLVCEEEAEGEAAEDSVDATLESVPILKQTDSDTEACDETWKLFETPDDSEYSCAELESTDGKLTAKIYQNRISKEYTFVKIEGSFESVSSEDANDNSLYERFPKNDYDPGVIEGGSKDEGIIEAFDNAKCVWFKPDSNSTCTTYAHLFEGFKNATVIKLTSVCTKNVTDMSYMLNGCAAMKQFIVDSDFSTANVTSMRGIFEGCSSVKYTGMKLWINKYNSELFNTAKVTDMSYMFADCTELTEALELSSSYKTHPNWDVKNVTTMHSMFENCKKVDFSQDCFSNFETRSITDMGSMFEGCESISTVDLSHINKSKVQNFKAMFKNCKNLSSLGRDFGWNVPAATDMSELFMGCEKFYDCTAYGLFEYEGFYINCVYIPNVTDVSSMFEGCTDLTSIALTFNAPKVKKFDRMFKDCSNLVCIDFVDQFSSEVAVSMEKMFEGCSSLREIDFSGFKTENLEDASDLFKNCSSLEYVDMSSFNTTKVIDMDGVFEGCSAEKLEEIRCPKINGGVTVELPGTMYEKDKGIPYSLLPRFMSNGEEYITLVKSANVEIELVTYGIKIDGSTKLEISDGIISGLPNLMTSTRSYDFGWYTKESGGEQVKDGDKYVGAYDKLYARWTLRSFTVDFETFGGGDVNSVTCLGGGNVISRPEKIPSKEGYIFDNWYKDSDCTSIWKFSKDVVNDNITLYAKWVPVTYNIKFVSGGNSTGSMEGMTGCMTGQEITLSKNTFKKEGHVFDGWNTSPDGEGVSYADEAQVSNLTLDNESTVILYAMWKKSDDAYTITYELNGGTNNESNPSSYTSQTKTIKFANPTKPGYTFSGWFLDEDFEDDVLYIARGSYGDVKIYAKWEQRKYQNTLMYNANGGTGAPANKVVTVTYPKTQSKITVSTTKPKRTGYTFNGWYTARTGGTKVGTTYTLGTANKTANQTATLYAQWKANTYKITYNTNGGTNDIVNPTSYQVTTGDIKLKSPKMKGYTFNGWYTDSKFTKRITVIKKGSTGNKTLYAKWTANKYTIKFNANGGKGTMANKTMTYDKAAKLTRNKFTKSGYAFKGWATSKANAQAGKVKYKNQAAVKNITSTNGKIITLYAVWKKK